MELSEAQAQAAILITAIVAILVAEIFAHKLPRLYDNMITKFVAGLIFLAGMFATTVFPGYQSIYNLRNVLLGGLSIIFLLTLFNVRNREMKPHWAVRVLRWIVILSGLSLFVYYTATNYNWWHLIHF